MCTLEKRGNIFILTLTGNDEHRLNPSIIQSIRSALSQVKSQATSSSALITTAHGKFFSNGFDLRWASAAATAQSSSASAESNFMSRFCLMVESMKLLFGDLLSLPMPTIAAVTGHAAAGGFFLVLSHDYVVMRKDRGVFYVSELDINMSLPDYCSAIFREKVGAWAARKKILLRAAKIRAEEAVSMGIVDSAQNNAEEVLKAAVKQGEELAARGWNGEVYGEIRKSLYPETCKLLGLTTGKIIVAPRL